MHMQVAFLCAFAALSSSRLSAEQTKRVERKATRASLFRTLCQTRNSARAAQTDRLSTQWRRSLTRNAHRAALLALASLDSPTASCTGQSITVVAFPIAIDLSFSLAGACFIHIVMKGEGEVRVSHSRPSSLSKLLQFSTTDICSSLSSARGRRASENVPHLLVDKLAVARELDLHRLHNAQSGLDTR